MSNTYAVFISWKVLQMWLKPPRCVMAKLRDGRSNAGATKGERYILSQAVTKIASSVVPAFNARRMLKRRY